MERIEGIPEVTFPQCLVCGTYTRAEDGILVCPHTDVDCEEALEYQKLIAAGDEERINAHLQRVNERLASEQPKVYCQLCDRVFVESHRHEGYQDGVKTWGYTAIPFEESHR